MGGLINQFKQKLQNRKLLLAVTEFGGKSPKTCGL